MFRLLRWGFLLLSGFIALAGIQWTYQRFAALSPNLPDNLLPAPDTQAVRYRGVEHQRLAPGSLVPGTDIRLEGIENEGAVFAFADLKTRKIVGDAVNYQGPWHDLPRTDYIRTSRIIRLTDTEVYLVSWYSLTISGVAPSTQSVPMSAELPYTALVRANRDSHIPGTMLTFRGRTPSGAARIEGQADDTYGQFQVLESVQWSGQLRDDLMVRYNMRVIFYTDAYVQLGGFVTLIPVS